MTNPNEFPDSTQYRYGAGNGTLTVHTAPATESQRAFIRKLAAERPAWHETLQDGGLYERCWDVCNDPSKFVSKAEASGVIDALKAIRPAVTRPTTPARPQTVRGASALDLSEVPTGRYGVPGGDTRLKVLIQQGTGKWDGWTFVKDAAEYGQGRKYGAQRPGGHYTGDIEAELRAIVADLHGAVARYGELTGHCCRCNRKLEDEVSVALGIGPDCRQHWGW